LQIDSDTIMIENIHYQGTWKCIVKSIEMNSTWVTNQMEVKGSLNYTCIFKKINLQLFSKKSSWNINHMDTNDARSNNKNNVSK
jgi:hypothetical protein